MIEFNYLDNFLKSAKKLRKRYRNIGKDIKTIEAKLGSNPKFGVDLGGGFFKIRVQNSDKNSGAKGGYRVITYFIEDDEIIYFVEIYDKSEKDSISKTQIEQIIREEF